LQLLHNFHGSANEGPIDDPQNKHNDEIHRVESHLVLPRIGCIVICHGLVSAPHLNGELGDVRGDVKHDGNEIRLAVYFEEKSLKSVWVKPENLRIVFELSSE
jgi:hypothetical protein